MLPRRRVGEMEREIETCNVCCNTRVGPSEMRMASMHSITAFITCGDCNIGNSAERK